MGVLEEWLAAQLKSPLGQLIWLVALALTRLLARFSSKTRKRKRPTPRKSQGTT